VVPLGQVEAQPVDRFASGSDELDRVLGGGFVHGGVLLIGGDPGIGKSTLLLQTAAHVARLRPTLYISGEESMAQIALRAARLFLSDSPVALMAEIALERIQTEIRQRRPELVVIDSIQTLFSEEISAAPGSVSQVRECAAQLTRVAKTTGTALVLIGHVTKEGTLAGPRVLEHMVDTVLYFEGDAHSQHRLIRSIKNRFGAVNELGIFAMTERGLKAVSNPSALFLSQHPRPVAGSSVLVSLEGSRPLLVEIQALVDASSGAHPRRLAVGLDAQRLSLLLAVLHRHAGVSCHDQDVFLNAVGGVSISEPAVDLACVFSIVSSLENRPLGRGIATFGEIGLAGEIRPSPRGQERIREAVKLGYTHLILPRANAPRTSPEGVHLRPIERLDQALQALWDETASIGMA
jgi:DNA repair protein RadA/Sms